MIPSHPGRKSGLPFGAPRQGLWLLQAQTLGLRSRNPLSSRVSFLWKVWLSPKQVCQEGAHIWFTFAGWGFRRAPQPPQQAQGGKGKIPWAGVVFSVQGGIDLSRCWVSLRTLSARPLLNPRRDTGLVQPLKTSFCFYLGSLESFHTIVHSWVLYFLSVCLVALRDL